MVELGNIEAMTSWCPECRNAQNNTAIKYDQFHSTGSLQYARPGTIKALHHWIEQSEWNWCSESQIRSKIQMAEQNASKVDILTFLMMEEILTPTVHIDWFGYNQQWTRSGTVTYEGIAVDFLDTWCQKNGKAIPANITASNPVIKEWSNYYFKKHMEIWVKLCKRLNKKSGMVCYAGGDTNDTPASILDYMFGSRENVEYLIANYDMINVYRYPPRMDAVHRGPDNIRYIRNVLKYKGLIVYILTMDQGQGTDNIDVQRAEFRAVVDAFNETGYPNDVIAVYPFVKAWGGTLYPPRIIQFKNEYLPASDPGVPVPVPDPDPTPTPDPAPIPVGNIIVAKDGSGHYTTIQAAVDASKAGDVIHVRPGTYLEEVRVWSPKGGNVNNYLKIIGLPGAIVDSQGRNTGGANDNWSGCFWVKAAWVWVEGFELRNGHSGVHVENGQYVVIKNNKITGSTESAIKIGGWVNKGTTHHVTVQGNIVSRERSSPWQEIISVSFANDGEISNNHILRNNGGEGIDVKDDSHRWEVHDNLVEDTRNAGVYAGGFEGGVTDVHAYGNFVIGKTRRIEIGVAIGDETGQGTTGAGCVFENNYAENCDTGMGSMYAGSHNFTGAVFKNNKVFNCGTPYNQKASGITFVNNTVQQVSPIKFKCNPSKKVCEYDASGVEFDACLSNCSGSVTPPPPPIESYNCVNNTCVKVSGSGGQYPTLASCQASGCSQPPPQKRYKCVDGTCLEYPGGQYATLAECKATCENPAVQRWKCGGVATDYYCVPVPAGTPNSWPDKKSCEENCEEPAHGSYSWNGLNCVVVPDGTMTWEECELKYGSGSPPPVCTEGTTRQVQCPQNPAKLQTQKCINNAWVTIDTTQCNPDTIRYGCINKVCTAVVNGDPATTYETLAKCKEANCEEVTPPAPNEIKYEVTGGILILKKI